MCQRKPIRLLVTSALLLAVGLVLPFLTGQLPVLGKLMSPLHIPAYLCGLVCGPVWGVLLGILLPLLRMLLFGMPMLPSALPMAFECAAYGLCTGLIYRVTKARFANRFCLPIFCAMIPSMMAGRIVGGLTKALFLASGVIASQAPFTFSVFIASYFVDTSVGALIHLILVPLVMAALKKARLVV